MKLIIFRWILDVFSIYFQDPEVMLCHPSLQSPCPSTLENQPSSPVWLVRVLYIVMESLVCTGYIRSQGNLQKAWSTECLMDTQVSQTGSVAVCQRQSSLIKHGRAWGCWSILLCANYRAPSHSVKALNTNPLYVLGKMPAHVLSWWAYRRVSESLWQQGIGDLMWGGCRYGLWTMRAPTVV